MSTVISERIGAAEVEADLDLQTEADMLPMAPAMIPAAPAPAAPARPDARGRVLNGLLRMADNYRDSGSLRQAIELYFELVHQHAETAQGESATDRLLEIARGYEMNGELRAARSIYEQLL